MINLDELELQCRGTASGKMIVCLTCADCLALIRVARATLKYSGDTMHDQHCSVGLHSKYKCDCGYDELMEALKVFE